jgi:hypothetical protein
VDFPVEKPVDQQCKSWDKPVENRGMFLWISLCGSGACCVEKL